MKILSKDKQTRVLKVDNAEDLWYLSQIIDPGDFIRGKTERKIKLGKTDQNQKIIKKTVNLSLEVTKTEYGENFVRISGIVNEGQEDIPKGVHHTISIKEGDTLKIIKTEWFDYQLSKLNDACSPPTSKIMIVLMDRDEVHYALLKQRGIQRISDCFGAVAKKDLDENIKGNFYEDVAKQILEYVKRYALSNVILASPAFWKDEVLKKIEGTIKNKIILATSSSGNPSSFSEVIKRDEVKTALHDERTSEEMKIVDKLLEEISKEGKAVYGFDEVQKVIVSGASEILIVTDGLISKRKEEDTFLELNELMKQASQLKSKIVVISSEHDGGKKLDGLGGIGAILRYKI